MYEKVKKSNGGHVEDMKAIDTLRPGKASEQDKITTEMLHALGEIEIDKITDLCDKIFDTGYIQDDMKKSTFIPILKKAKAVNCTDFRTISLMSHVTEFCYFAKTSSYIAKEQ